MCWQQFSLKAKDKVRKGTEDKELFFRHYYEAL